MFLAAMTEQIEKMWISNGSWGHLGGLLGPSWRLGRRLGLRVVLGSLGAVLGRQKTSGKFHQQIDASWDRFLEEFVWIWGGKSEASWQKTRSKTYQLKIA